MPVIQRFTISNFKGIDEVQVDLDGKQTCPVITLIGLNESGKTTILEALSLFTSSDRTLDSLFERSDARNLALSLIPMHRKAAFSDEIGISATVQLDSEDVVGLQAIVEKHGLILSKAAAMKPFRVRQILKYEDSLSAGQANHWSIDLRAKKLRARNFRELVANPKDGSPNIWLECVEYIRDRIPQIAYFPTFLVDVPAKIYLKEHSDETGVNRQYRLVIQDVLEALNEGLSLQKHVVDRIEAFKTSATSPSWLSSLLGSPSKGPIDSVFQKLSGKITHEVIGNWQRIFERAISATTIILDWNVDTEKGDLPYVTFNVSDGNSRFAIGQRSLGFRWFFSFLLFTNFKQNRSRKTIFLFDEPAANLHAKAQAQLLKSFARIATKGNQVIYSTHSHHMINPKWLSGAYIVENEALDYERSESFELENLPTKIMATPYRRFLSDYPSRSSYFQPVVEALQYVTPELVGVAPFVVVEGISDYYALSLAAQALPTKVRFNLMPGLGSGASGPLISQMMGRGERFIVLLDDDREGRKAADRYKSEWFLSDKVVLTLGMLDEAHIGSALERILGEELMDSIRSFQGAVKQPSKKQIGLYLAEGCAQADPARFLPASTMDRLHSVLSALDSRIEDLVRQSAT